LDPRINRTHLVHFAPVGEITRDTIDPIGDGRESLGDVFPDCPIGVTSIFFVPVAGVSRDPVEQRRKLMFCLILARGEG
jgi:hypothetical protein